jgi:hypothetical protein
MSTIYQCDKCKRNVGEVTKLFRISQHRLVDSRVNESTGIIVGELCSDCADVVRQFVRGEGK